MFGSRVPDSAAFRESVGQAIIDEITKRTLSGIDINDKRFKPYRGKGGKPTAYTKTIEFKAAGKSVGNPNLRLTGDMLRDMDINSDKSDRKYLIIGFNDAIEQKKAHGHITGHPRGPGVKRDFFGLPDKKLAQLSKDFTLPTDEPKDEEVGLLGTLSTLKEIFSLG